MNSENNVFSFLESLADSLKDKMEGLKLIKSMFGHITDAAEAACQNMKELKEMEIDMQVAAGVSETKVSSMMDSYNKLAMEISSTTKATAESAQAFHRMGKSVSETCEMIRSSEVLAKIGMTDSGSAAAYLVEGMDGYGTAASKSMDIVDRLTAVGIESKTAVGDLAEAMAQAAESANAGGTSMDRLIGYIAAVGKNSTISMAEVGSSFKNIYERMGSLMSNPLGDGGGENLADMEEELNSLGVYLRDSADQYLAFDDVLDQVGARWNSLTQKEQEALSVAMAGSSQRESFIVLMDNYSKALEYSGTAARSAGTAMEQYGIYQDTLEAKTNELTTAFEALAGNTFSDELAERVVKAATGIVEFVDKSQLLKGAIAGLAVIEVSKFSMGILAGVNSLRMMTAAFSGLKTDTSEAGLRRVGVLCRGLSDSQLELILSTKGLSQAQQRTILTASGLEAAEVEARLGTLGFAAAEQGATGATFSLTGAMQALKTAFLTNPIGAVITAITAAVSLGTMAFGKYKQVQDDIRRSAQEAADALSEQRQSIADFVARYNELHVKINSEDTTEERQIEIKKELLKLQKEINERYGEQYGKVNLVTDAYRDQSELIERLNQEFAKTYLNENIKEIKQATKEMEKETHYTLSNMPYSPFSEKGQIMEDIVKKHEDKGLEFNADEINGAFSINLKANARDAYSIINEFMNDVKAKAKELGDETMFDDVLETSSQELHKAKKTIDDYGKKYDEARISTILGDSGLFEQYGEAIKAVEAYNEAVADGNREKIMETRASLKLIRGSFDLEGDDWSRYDDIINDIFDQADTRVLDFSEAVKNNQGGIANWAEALRGKSNVDLLSMNDDGDNGDSFDKLKEKAASYKMSVDELIASLIELGYVQDVKKDQAPLVRQFSYKETIEKLDEMSDPFSTLGAAYQKLEDKNSKMEFSDLSALNEKFRDVNGIENYIKKIEEAKGDSEKAQQAFNDLTSAYLRQSGILDMVNEGNQDLIANTLTGMGVTNAETLVQQALADNLERVKASKYLAANSSLDLAAATEAEITGLINEGAVSQETAVMLARFALEKRRANGDKISTSDDIDQLIGLANTARVTAEEMARLKKAQDTVARVEKLGDNATSADKKALDDSLNYLNDPNAFQYDKLNAADFKVPGVKIKDSGKDAGSTRKFSQEINHIDRVMEVSKRRLQNYKSALEDALTPEEKNAAIDDIVKESEYQYGQMISVQQYYANKAEEILAQIPEAIREKVKYGAEEIENLNDENLSKLIKQFQDFDASAYAAGNQVRELKNSIHDMKVQKIQIRIEGLERTKSKLERLQDQYETAILAVTSSIQSEIDEVNSYYDSQNDNIQKQIDALDEQNDKLEIQRSLEEALYNLRRAENQRTTRIYREGQGFVYEADQAAVREAQESYDSAQMDKTRYDLEQILDRLEEERNQEVDYLTGIMETWDGIAETFEHMADMRMADELFGTDSWLEDILNGDTGLFEDMQENFGSVFEGIFHTDQVIESLNDLKDWVENGEMSEDTALAVMNQQLTQLGENAAVQSESMGEGLNSIYASAENAKTLSADTYAAWTESLSIFQTETLAVCESLVVQFNEMANAVVLAVERARQAAEEMDSLGGGDDGEGVTTTKEPIRASSSSGRTSAKHHKGILNGTNGSPNSENERVRGLKIISTEPLKSNEVPIIALDDEVSLTREQQEMTIRNFRTALMPKLSLYKSSYPTAQAANREPARAEYNFNGGIHITEARNVTDIARGVKTGMLKQALDQELYKR